MGRAPCGRVTATTIRRARAAALEPIGKIRPARKAAQARGRIARVETAITILPVRRGDKARTGKIPLALKAAQAPDRIAGVVET